MIFHKKQTNQELQYMEANWRALASRREKHGNHLKQHPYPCQRYVTNNVRIKQSEIIKNRLARTFEFALR